MRGGWLRRLFGARRERELERLVEERTRALAEETARAEQAPAEPPILDAATLDSLFRLEQLAGKEIVRGVVDSFVGEAPGRVARMRQAIAEGDAEGLAFAAHGFKGSAAQLGALRLAEACQELEERGRVGDLDGADELVRRLQGEVTRAAAALQARIRGLIPSPLSPTLSPVPGEREL
jgi:HPt (histidine-containing phosphotransfer) domain-containing protein